MIMVLAPGGAGNLTMAGAPSGSTYVSDQYGVIRITNDSAADQAALLAAGCTPLSTTAGGSLSCPGEIDTVNASPYQLPGDGSNYFDLTNATGAAIVILLPLAPANGQFCVVTDVGNNAGAHNWTIKAGSTVIDTVSVDGGYSKARWNGSEWVVTG